MLRLKNNYIEYKFHFNLVCKKRDDATYNHGILCQYKGKIMAIKDRQLEQMKCMKQFVTKVKIQTSESDKCNNNNI